MSIVFARVDDRLIHGQIVQGWLPKIKTDAVVIVHAQPLGPLAMLMRMALPADYQLHHGSAAEMAEFIKTSPLKLFVLIYSLKEAEELINAGADITNLNIGGLHFADGKEEVCNNFFLNAAEKEIIKRLNARGVEIDCRAVPKTENINILSRI